MKKQFVVAAALGIFLANQPFALGANKPYTNADGVRDDINSAKYNNGLQTLAGYAAKQTITKPLHSAPSISQVMDEAKIRETMRRLRAADKNDLRHLTIGQAGGATFVVEVDGRARDLSEEQRTFLSTPMRHALDKVKAPGSVDEGTGVLDRLFKSNWTKLSIPTAETTDKELEASLRALSKAGVGVRSVTLMMTDELLSKALVGYTLVQGGVASAKLGHAAYLSTKVSNAPLMVTKPRTIQNLYSVSNKQAAKVNSGIAN